MILILFVLTTVFANPQMNDFLHTSVEEGRRYDLTTDGTLILNSKGDYLGLANDSLIKDGLQRSRLFNHFTVPFHPFMATQSNNNMHNDSYITDTYDREGIDIAVGDVKYFQYGSLGLPGQCAGQNFDKYGRILTVCLGPRGAHLVMVSPQNMQELGRLELPSRPGTWDLVLQGRADLLLEDTSGGAYFYLDEKDRAIIATSDREIWAVSNITTSSGKVEFIKDEIYDLKSIVPNSHCPSLRDRRTGPDPRCDKVTTALPDFDGRIWYVTRYGRIGWVKTNINSDGQRIQIKSGQLKLDQNGVAEEIQNSFAVGNDGVYIVSNYALYRLQADAANYRPEIAWRQTYNRGTRKKPGIMTQGSGTTPTLLGDDYIAIADNADPKMNIVVYKRKLQLAPGESRQVCKIGVFKDGLSGTENSLIGFNNSLIVENNYGHVGPFSRNESSQAGIARVDFDPLTKTCTKRWENMYVDSLTTVPKLSSANGLIYLYTRKYPDRRPIRQRWYLTTLDFNTGNLVSSHYMGRGVKYNNNWSAIAIGPGLLPYKQSPVYVGTFYGFLQVLPY